MKIGRAKVSNLRKLYENCIKVHDISEPLYLIEAEEDARKVKGIMAERDFNVAGIKKGKNVIGYLRREELNGGICGDYLRSFKNEELVKVDTPLLFHLSLFKNSTHLFGLEGTRVHYIITRSDLQKIPMRMILFGLLSLMELHLLNLARKYYPQNQWVSLLSKSRLDKAIEIQNFRKEKNEVIDLLECIQFGDKKKIFEKTPVLVDSTKKTKNQLHDFFEDAELLRDNLAHVQDFLSGKSWAEFIQLIKDIQEFILHCEAME